MPNPTRNDEIDLMFRAFSDRTRLRILHLLLAGESCVGDLVTVLELPQPTVSRHLAYLRRAGLVSTRRRGAWVDYRLAPHRNAFHAKLIECLTDCFGGVPELAEDAIRSRDLQRLRAASGASAKAVRPAVVAP